MPQMLQRMKWLASKAVENPTLAINRASSILSHRIENVVADFSRQPTTPNIINRKEIRVIGMRRSGNHAIINWIEKQETGKVVHLNDIRLNENPYRCIYKSLYNDHPKNHWVGAPILRYPQYSGKEGLKLLEREARGDFDEKDCLLYSYEDFSLDRLTSKQAEKNHDRYFGKSALKYDILILRDPFNLLASRLKKNRNQSVRSLSENVIDMWISYAREYLGETNYLKNHKIVINYNQWVIDSDYRKLISSKLGLTFSDLGINDVNSFGGGSSFDKQKFQGKAAQMDFFNRWKYLTNDIFYLSLLKNDTLIQYSKRIFGHIPGTESLIL